MLNVYNKIKFMNWRINIRYMNGLLLISAVLGAVIVMASASESKLMDFEQKLDKQIKSKATMKSRNSLPVQNDMI